MAAGVKGAGQRLSSVFVLILKTSADLALLRRDIIVDWSLFAGCF